MNLRKSSTYRAEAIVLRRRDLGEADRIVTLFTREHGKRRAVAKSSRRPQSRLAGHVELFTHADVFLVVGASLDILSQARAVEVFPSLAEDLGRFAMASFAAEMVDRLTPDAEPDPRLFDLLLEAIRLVAGSDRPSMHLRHFELAALGVLGYGPHLGSCVVCDGDLAEDEVHFSPRAGGVVCLRCTARTPGVSMSDRALKVMRWMSSQELGAVSRLRETPGLDAELERLHRAYVAAVLEGDLRSGELLDRIRPGAGTGAPAG